MDIEKLSENKYIRMTIKILIGVALSATLAIIFLNNFKVKKNDSQQIKVNTSKGNRTNYPKTESIWAVLEIPSLKIKTNVYRGEDSLLNYGALHHKESYFPKDGGTILIGANINYLKNITKVKNNDEIILKTMYGTYKYKIEKIRTRSIEELNESLEIKNDEEKLILYTSDKNNKNSRFVIYAK